MSVSKAAFSFLLPLVLAAGCDRGDGRTAAPSEIAPPRGPVAVAQAPANESTGTGGDAPDVVYTCPMHPDVKSKTPGRCPECGMDLVPKKP